MNTPVPPESTPKISKLMIRSEVLAVVRHLISLADPPKMERLKQIKRLQELEPMEDVLDILVKELQRCTSPKILHVVTQLLMELGTIEYLQDKLWTVIRDTTTTDEVKDAANLILRHLGDPTDPELYLEYLEDPQGLIGRETVRMLEISAENPEALIDFIDFILSLNLEDQVRLLESLQREYPSEYLINIYIPLLESDPAPELWEQLIENLAQTRSPEAAFTLARLESWPDERLPVSRKLIVKSLKTLQLAGVYHPDQPLTQALPATEIHPMAKETLPYQCFATISDGIGNQGILFSRQRANGDVTMMSVALNDLHGIVDCFGFYQLTMADFFKIIEKFHEGASKIKVSPEYCAYKLNQAEALNRQRTFRLPYEYRCWKPMLDGIAVSEPEALKHACEEWVRQEWFSETNNLYQHPDFDSWFLEQGDEPAVTPILQRVTLLAEDYLHALEADTEPLISQLEALADTLIMELLKTSWRAIFIQRLKEAAYLMNCQDTHTFRNLAATEAYKLQHVKEPEHLLTGFIQAYGRRCVLEELLRLQSGHTQQEELACLTQTLGDVWKV